MSGMDLFEDGFPHSTVAGWERGCRGAACPGRLEYGFSCAEAFTRSRGDFRYQRMVAEGMTPAEIGEAMKPQPTAKEAGKRMRQTPSVTVADSMEPVEPKPKRTRLVEPKPKAEPSPIPHGTQAGYQRGCRDECPGHPVWGRTCRAAANAFQRDYKLRRLLSDGQPLGQSKRKPVAGEPVEARGRVGVARTVLRRRFLSFVQVGDRQGLFERHESWSDAMERATSLTVAVRSGERVIPW